MNLAASASSPSSQSATRGYAMAALLIAMAIMAVLMTVALPTWKQTMQREKEEELVFRGEQYARAIGAYQRKYANASPPTIDALVEQHFLRRKYKDPLAITEDGEFAPLYVDTQAGRNGGGTGGGASAGTGSGAAGRNAGSGTSGNTGAVGLLASTTPSGGGIVGVASKNPGTSIRTYKDRTHYNEWQFMALQQSVQAGSGGQGQGQGTGLSGGRGQGQGRGQGRGTDQGSGQPGSGQGRQGQGGRGPGSGPGGDGPRGPAPGGFPPPPQGR